MAQVTNYAVVVFTDLNTLVAEVNSLAQRGWHPLGGIEVSAQGSSTYHYQAVVKYSGQ